MRGATDSHFHVFDSPDRYPYSGALRYPPPHAPLEAYLELAKADGIERMVFVQPSAYGTDNRCMLDAVARVGENARGIVALEGSTTDEQLAALSRAGVRGVRINVSPVEKFDRALPSRIAAEALATAYKIRDLGWHLDFLAPAWLVTALIPTLRSLPVDFTVAHLGMFAAAKGVDQPGFDEFLDLLVHGRGWAKLTGFYRISQRPKFDDVKPLALATIVSNPDRVIWGSDWPHLSFAERTTNAKLLRLLREWCPEGIVRKILVENPARLFGFEASG